MKTTNIVATDKPNLTDAQKVNVRMELAAAMLAHAHTISIDHLQELSAFVLSGRRKKKPVEMPLV